MNRRELLQLIAAATGGVVIGGEFLLAGCKNPESSAELALTENDIAFLDEIAETILPKSTTAGAKDAGVGRFMMTWVNDCYKKEDQEIFQRGLIAINEASEKMHGHDFMKATPEQRTTVLNHIDDETKAYVKQQKEFDKVQEEALTRAFQTGDRAYKVKTMPNHYFQQIKQLTIFGYFTSERGRKESLRYVPVPGKWEAVIDYKKGDKLFAGIN